jgi:AMMECR1 domain-containing protein
MQPLSLDADAVIVPPARRTKSLFASFSSEKEESFFCSVRDPVILAHAVRGCVGFFKKEKESSFSEEKEAKRLLGTSKNPPSATRAQ